MLQWIMWSKQALGKGGLEVTRPSEFEMEENAMVTEFLSHSDLDPQGSSGMESSYHQGSCLP